MLVRYTQINARHFAHRSRPGNAVWVRAIENGEVVGRVLDGTAFIDEEAFMFNITVQKPISPELDLLG